MQEKSDISSVRRSNFLAVSGYLRRRESATIPQLAEETGLSLPTVTRAINSGITLRIFTSCGICDSDRGRKAVSYAINPDFMHCAIIYFFSDTLHFDVFDFCFKRLFEYKCEINDDNALETLDFAVNGDILRGARGKAGDIGKIFTPMADRQNLEFYSYQLRAIISVLDPDRIVLYPTDDGCTFDMLVDKAAECFGEEIRSRFVRNCDLYTDCLSGLLWLVNDELKTTFE